MNKERECETVHNIRQLNKKTAFSSFCCWLMNYIKWMKNCWRQENMTKINLKIKIRIGKNIHNIFLYSDTKININNNLIKIPPQLSHAVNSKPI